MSRLLLPVTVVKGIGEETAKDLEPLGIHTVHDLLFYFPSRYEDYTIQDLSEVADGERVTIAGTLYGEPSIRFYGRTKSRMTVQMVVDDLVITAIWFNQHFLKSKLKHGQEIQLTGKWERHRMHLIVSETKTKLSAQVQEKKIEPIYPVSLSVTVKQMRKYITQAMGQFKRDIDEVLPPDVVKKYEFISRAEAICWIHFPPSHEQGGLARKRLVFEELFLYQLKMQALRFIQKKASHGAAMQIPLEEIRTFVRSFPFKLTGAQKLVIKEILDDLMSPQAMNRLLQGDVGSGKTVVAAVALLAAVKSGYQAALMVPTEILAEQHFQTLAELLQDQGTQMELLTGSLGVKGRRDILAGLQIGMLDIIVGTHALIQEDVFFHKLGLVITDEQHRFGVEQRKILRQKGLQPNVLFMTATPIPRTLSLSVFGDMDVSTIDELPAGRKKIETYWVKPDRFDRVIQFIEKELRQSRQAYVICPLIEESEKLDVQNAIELHAQLNEHFRDYYAIGLMHGKLPAKEKDFIMKNFSENKIQVLVSTTVVEVGVNVPNATVMAVYDADRFGLAQLHQLRGRVGRGEHQSYCILIADPRTETGKERMRIMKETSDGFEVARQDLALRGPGDFFGTKQSGLPEFKIADLIQDLKELQEAREEAVRFIQNEDFWTSPEFSFFREYLNQQGVMDWVVWD